MWKKGKHVTLARMVLALSLLVASCGEDKAPQTHRYERHSHDEVIITEATLTEATLTEDAI